jgi:ribosomal protein S18 acetylase RimI-like enzyme
MQTQPQCTFRRTVTENDKQNVREILESTGFFYDFEIDVAVELVEESLKTGEACGYHFVFADVDGKTVGYTCFGDIPCTNNSYDIYWIGVHQSQRGMGLGGLLLLESERIIYKLGGNRVYLETSSMEKYIPTRSFYLKYGYEIEAQIKDFYDYDDDKVLFGKKLKPKSTVK